MSDWSAVRIETIRVFGETPYGDLEQEVIDFFDKNPLTTLSYISHIQKAMERGQSIRSPWALLRSMIRSSPEDVSDASVVVVDQGRREKRVKAAQAWIRNAGLYCESPDDILSELFEHGLLQEWAYDAGLQADMVRYWESLRPRGQQAEAEQLAYQQKVCRPPAWLRGRDDGKTKVQTDVSDHEAEDGVSGDVRAQDGEPQAS